MEGQINMSERSSLIRAHKDFKRIVNMVRAKFILEGKIPPTTSKITMIIAKDIDTEKLLGREFIRL